MNLFCKLFLISVDEEPEIQNVNEQEPRDKNNTKDPHEEEEPKDTSNAMRDTEATDDISLQNQQDV